MIARNPLSGECFGTTGEVIGEQYEYSRSIDLAANEWPVVVRSARRHFEMRYLYASKTR